MRSAEIKIGSFMWQVESIPPTTARDRLVPDITQQAEPVPVEDWPITPAELESAANEKLVECGGKPYRKDDCLWALGVIGVHIDDGWVFRRATTSAQRATEQDEARLASLRGELV